MNRSTMSPTSPARRKSTTLPGFRPSPRPKQRPISEMTVRELQDLHKFNIKILSSPCVTLPFCYDPRLLNCALYISSNASTSTYVNRVQAEQAAVESRLIELDGMETINTGLRRTMLRGEGDMVVDSPPEPTTSRAIEAKKKALAQFVSWPFSLGSSKLTRIY